MHALADFPITQRWPARYPERLQLYALNTPNGVKASIMLEELGLPYEPHIVHFEQGEQKTPEFRSLNPYGKIPAIIDPDGPGGRPLPLFESGAILLYLAEKTGRLLPRDPAQRYAAIQWMIFQVADIGPMFGQVGYFVKFDGKEYPDKRPRDHYIEESKRILGVLDERLANRPWMIGDAYTIADIAIFPLVRNLIKFYKAGDLVGISNYPHVTRSLDTFLARPAVHRGLEILAPR